MGVSPAAAHGQTHVTERPPRPRHAPEGPAPKSLVATAGIDDGAVVMNLAGRGLVILTGCGHAGLLNTIYNAIELTGERRVHAVVGGFHLSGPLFEKVVAPTCQALEEFSIDHLVPSHCTGWRATHEIAARFPDAFIQNSVGTRFEFTATAG